eukprot:4714119-Prymnesium_polylepis.1
MLTLAGQRHDAELRQGPLYGELDAGGILPLASSEDAAQRATKLHAVALGDHIADQQPGALRRRSLGHTPDAGGPVSTRGLVAP